MKLVCVFALAFIALASSSTNPSAPYWGPEVSMNVSLGGTLQYSASRQELFLFSQVEQLRDLDWEFFEYHEILNEAPYFGMYLNCNEFTLSFYIPDVLLGGLVCYNLPSRMSMDILNEACPLTNDAFQYFLHYKQGNLTYLGTLKYGYDDTPNVYVWGISRITSWQWCCNPSYVSYRDWCCPMYYDGSSSRTPVAFTGRYNRRSVYTSGYATPAPWTPPTASSCRRINPDPIYTVPNPNADVPPSEMNDKETEMEMEDTRDPLVSLLWSKIKKTNDLFSIFSFLSMEDPLPHEVPPMDVTNELPKQSPPHAGSNVHSSHMDIHADGHHKGSMNDGSPSMKNHPHMQGGGKMHH